MRLILATLALASFPQFYAPEKGGGEGGASAEKPTLKQELASAEMARDEAKSALEKAMSDKDGLKSQLDQAKEKLTALEGEKSALSTQLGVAQAEVTKLQGEAKSSQDRANEIAAANGVQATTKAETTLAAAAGTGDGKALFDQYQKLMNAGDSAAASEFWAKHEKALMAHANSKEAAAL